MSTPEKRKAVYDAVFGAPSLLPERFGELPRKRSMFEALRGLPQRVLIAGPMRAHPCTIEVTHDGKRASCEFIARDVEHWYGYVHESGLSIRISRAVERDGEWVHLTECTIDTEAAIDLTAEPDLWALLELCTPTAKLVIDGEEFLEIASFGDLLRFGFFARNLRVISKLKQPVAWLLEADLRDEFLHSLGCLAAIVERQINISALSAMLGPREKSEDDFAERGEIMWVPLAMNIPAGGLVVWLRVAATVFVDGDQLVGFRAETLLDVELESRSSAFSKTVWPEYVVRPEYPSIALSQEGRRHGTEDVMAWALSADIEDPFTRRPRHA